MTQSTLCFVEFDWTSGLYRFRIGQTFTDFRGEASWSALADCKEALRAGGCYLGSKSDTRTWPVYSHAAKAEG